MTRRPLPRWPAAFSTASRDAVAAMVWTRAVDAAAAAGAGGRYRTPARMRRVVAGYLAHVEAGQPMRRLARVAGFDRRQLQRACAVVEELRERAQWDAAIADLGGLA